MRKVSKTKAKLVEYSNLSRLPSLPKLPSFPKFDFQKEKNSFSINSLPSFPSSEFGGNMEKNAIKSSILPDLPDSELEDSEELGYPKDYRYAESNLNKAVEIEKEEEELGLPPPQIARILPENKERSEEIREKQVFVKLENYKQGMLALQEMKGKIEEILGLVSEINDARAREETELQQWQEEAEALRLKLDKIEKNLFSKT